MKNSWIDMYCEKLAKLYTRRRRYGYENKISEQPSSKKKKKKKKK